MEEKRDFPKEGPWRERCKKSRAVIILSSRIPNVINAYGWNGMKTA
jgi:hypothetical protein